MSKKTKLVIKDNLGKTKTYNLRGNFLFEVKFVFFLLIFIIVFLLFCIFLLKDKNSSLLNTIDSLDKEALNLKKTILDLNSTIKDANDALDISNDKIEDLKLEVAYSQTYDKNSKNYDEDIKIPQNLTSLFFRFIPNGVPIEIKRITSSFGFRVHPISGVGKMHHGIDLSANIGTPVIATADGFVEYSALSKTGYGFLVILTHNYGFSTRYGHLFNKSVVNAGQFVKKGQLIGYSGNTGYSTGPHLHYEVRFLERPLNPYNFMNWNINNFSSIFTLERMVPWRSIATELSI